MAAEIKLYIDYGGTDGSPSENHDSSSDSPNIRFKTEDNSDINSSGQVPIPAMGTRRSYWKSCYLKRTDSSPSTAVSSLSLHWDGTALPTGVVLKIGNTFPVKNSGSDSGYKLATGIENLGGDAAEEKHTGITSMVDITNYPDEAPLLITISETSNQLDAQNETSNYFILQLEVLNTADAATLDELPIEIDYLEV